MIDFKQHWQRESDIDESRLDDAAQRALDAIHITKIESFKISTVLLLAATVLILIGMVYFQMKQPPPSSTQQEEEMDQNIATAPALPVVSQPAGRPLFEQTSPPLGEWQQQFQNISILDGNVHVKNRIVLPRELLGGYFLLEIQNGVLFLLDSTGLEYKYCKNGTDSWTLLATGNEYTVLTGTVKDPQGNPLSGIRINAYHADKHALPAVRTDTDGKFLLRFTKEVHGLRAWLSGTQVYYQGPWTRSAIVDFKFNTNGATNGHE